ncbi:Adhesion G protein-coupled receptor A2, partial [Trichoplax sp. H2]
KLYKNSLSSLTYPRIFEGLSNLETLDLESSKIQRIGDRIFAGLQNLTKLSLNGNLLDSICSSHIFKGLYKLKYL